MRARSWIVPSGLAFVVLTLAALASRSRLSGLFSQDRPLFVPLDVPETEPPDEPIWSKMSDPPDPTAQSNAFDQVSNQIMVFAGVVAGLAVTIILAMVLYRAYRMRQSLRDTGEAEAEIVGEVRHEDVQRALHEARAYLDYDAGGAAAIVEAWLIVEERLTASWRPRHPHETSDEFVAMAVREAGAPENIVAPLSQLYRTAYFSGHDTAESDVREARRLLDAALAALEGRRSAPA